MRAMRARAWTRSSSRTSASSRSSAAPPQPPRPRLDADERHERRGRGSRARARVQARRRRPRAQRPRDRQGGRGNGRRGGGFRARGAVRELLGAVLLLRGVGRPVREQGAVRAGVQAPVRPRRGRSAQGHGRREVPAQPAGPHGRGDGPRVDRSRRRVLQDRGKAEGPEYVALTAAVYRRALDDAWEARAETKMETETETDDEDEEEPSARSSRKEKGKGGSWRLPEADRVALAQVFARGQDDRHDGLTRGFLEGPKHQRLVRGRNPRHRGVLLGEVVRSEVRAGGGVVVRLSGKGAAVKRGDGVVFDRARRTRRRLGGRCGRFWILGAGVRSRATRARGSIGARWSSRSRAPSRTRGRAPGVGEGPGSSGRRSRKPANRPGSRSGFETGGAREPAPGDLVWRTSDADLESRLRKMVPRESDARGSNPGGGGFFPRREPVTVRVTSAGVGSPIRVVVADAEGREGVAETSEPLTPAERRPMTLESLAKAIGQLGGTPFTLGELDVRGIRETPTPATRSRARVGD